MCTRLVFIHRGRVEGRKSVFQVPTFVLIGGIQRSSTGTGRTIHGLERLEDIQGIRSTMIQVGPQRFQGWLLGFGGLMHTKGHAGKVLIGTADKIFGRGGMPHLFDVFDIDLNGKVPKQHKGKDETTAIKPKVGCPSCMTKGKFGIHIRRFHPRFSVIILIIVIITLMMMMIRLVVVVVAAMAASSIASACLVSIVFILSNK